MEAARGTAAEILTVAELLHSLLASQERLTAEVRGVRKDMDKLQAALRGKGATWGCCSCASSKTTDASATVLRYPFLDAGRVNFPTFDDAIHSRGGGGYHCEYDDDDDDDDDDNNLLFVDEHSSLLQNSGDETFGDEENATIRKQQQRMRTPVKTLLHGCSGARPPPSPWSECPLERRDRVEAEAFFGHSEVLSSLQTPLKTQATEGRGACIKKWKGTPARHPACQGLPPVQERLLGSGSLSSIGRGSGCGDDGLGSEEENSSGEEGGEGYCMAQMFAFVASAAAAEGAPPEEVLLGRDVLSPILKERNRNSECGVEWAENVSARGDKACLSSQEPQLDSV